MVKSITLAIVAALFFSAGLFAGHGVQFSAKQATTHSVPAHGNAADSGTGSDKSVDAKNSEAANPLTFISNSVPSTSPDVQYAEFDGRQSDERPNAHRAAVYKLIQRHFPNTAKELAEVWADTYAEMDLDEIDFVLEQKRSISTTLAAEMHQLLPADAPISDPVDAMPQPTVNTTVRIVQSNLQSAYALGFRRMVVFPDVVSDSKLSAADAKGNDDGTCFRSFESGPLIQSPISTHAALTQTDSLMFLLDANRLTRRGDFRLLQDRRLGLVTRGGEFASAGSTSIPDDATHIRITADGTIQFENVAGETCDAGRISVCSVKYPDELQTDDGVFFQLSDSENLTLHDDVAKVLVTNALEQSNVDRNYEKSLMTQLKSLSESSD